MKLFIPTIGTRLVLAEPWTFPLHDEYRNEKFWMSIHGSIKTNEKTISTAKELQTDYYRRKKAEPISTTIPKGAILEVDRLYLKKGCGDYDSVTFRLISGIPKVKGRFWAKLDAVNTLVVDETQKIVRWPNGRFVLSIHNYQDNGASQNCRCGFYHERYAFVANCPKQCMCDQTQWPRRIEHGLYWQQFPEKSGSCKGVSVKHETHTNGLLNKLTERNNFNVSSGYSRPDYKKDFPNIEELVVWAKQKGFTLEHVEKFMEAFKVKKMDLPVVEQER